MTEVWSFLREWAENIGLVFVCLAAYVLYYNKHRL
jgi:hypothetical protein